MSDSEPPESVFVPQAPGIRKSPYAQSVDQTYRAIEASSAARADEAADHLERAYRDSERADPHQGDRTVVDELQKNQIAEMKSGIKITNMQDPTSMRPGDAAVTVPGAAEAAKRLGGERHQWFQQLDGTKPPDHAPGVGPQNSGDMTRQALASTHSSRAAAMIRAGQMAPAYNPERR